MGQNSKNKNISKLLDAMKISDKLVVLHDKADSEEAKPFLIRGKAYKPGGNKMGKLIEKDSVYTYYDNNGIVLNHGDVVNLLGKIKRLYRLQDGRLGIDSTNPSLIKNERAYTGQYGYYPLNNEDLKDILLVYKMDSESGTDIIFSIEFLMFANFVLIENSIVKDRNDMFEDYLCDLELLKKSHKNVLIQKDGVLEIYTNKENRVVFDNIISKIDIDKETLNRRIKIYEK